jgi:uncharacterized Zn finger protein (UPF0148 family)
MTTDNCVVCGVPVPEGRQVCPECAARPVKKKADAPAKPTPKKTLREKKKRRP